MDLCPEGLEIKELQFIDGTRNGHQRQLPGGSGILSYS